jgi:hypothetical protein
MGKTLLDLFADKANIPPQPGNTVPLTNAPYNKPFGINPIGQIVKKLVGEQGLQREEADLVQIGNFVKNIPKIYGTDSVRILTQSDPHAKKAAIKKAAGAVGSIFGTTGLGGLINKGISKIGDFNPKFPDDFLDGDTFSRYSDLAKSDYAGGKYYNGGIKNKKSELGKFLQANKTFDQIKNAAFGAAKTALVGLAIGGLKKLFSKKQKTLPGEPKKRPQPFFPSTLVLNSKPNSEEFIAYNQEQQSRRNDFPNKFGSDYTKVSKSIGVAADGAVSKLTNKEASLDNFYKEQFYNNSVYFDKEQYNLNNPNAPKGFRTPIGYNSRLGWHGEPDYNKAVGKYSKDVLRNWDPETKNWSDPYPSQKLADDAADGVYTGSLHLNFGITDISDAYDTHKIDSKDKIFNTVTYTTVSGLQQLIRYNKAGSGSYSQNVKDINDEYDLQFGLSADTYIQTQFKSDKKFPKLNPYLITKSNLLKNNENFTKDKTYIDTEYDYIRIGIGGVSVLGTITGLTDNVSPTWADVKSVGSGFKFYLYDSWEREISFKIQMYAENKIQLDQIWKKAERIKSLTLPTPKGQLGVYGELISLQIGNLINTKYGFLTTCNLTVSDVTSWEIETGKQKPVMFEIDITYKVVSNSDNKSYTFYEENLPESKK